MTLPTKSFDQMVSDMTASWSQSIGVVPSLSSGDGLLATFQSIATQLQFLQALAQIAVQVSRAQTSTGSDLDSFYAQFNFSRLPATQASGLETFNLAQASPNNILIPVGTTIQTSGAQITYTVIADTTQANYEPTLNAYVIAAGDLSGTATIQAVVAGAASNVSAGQLSILSASIPGISSVTNVYAISNGVNAESDADYRARFILYLASLTQATETAIRAAAQSVSDTFSIDLLENINGTGGAQAGAFTVLVDDQGSAPTSAQLQEVYNAVYAARAFTVQPFAIATTFVSITVALNIKIASGYSQATVFANVQAALETYINSIGIGNTLYLDAIVSTARSVAGVTSIELSSVLVNGSSADYTPTATETIQVSQSDITVGTY